MADGEDMENQNGNREIARAATRSLDALVGEFRDMELYHAPDDCPSVMMKDISALLDIIDAVRIVAFTQGAKWWEWHSRGGTMWQSDQIKTEEEAQRRLRNKTLGIMNTRGEEVKD